MRALVGLTAVLAVAAGCIAPEPAPDLVPLLASTYEEPEPSGMRVTWSPETPRQGDRVTLTTIDSPGAPYCWASLNTVSSQVSGWSHLGTMEPTPEGGLRCELPEVHAQGTLSFFAFVLLRDQWVRSEVTHLTVEEKPLLTAPSTQSPLVTQKATGTYTFRVETPDVTPPNPIMSPSVVARFCVLPLLPYVDCGGVRLDPKTGYHEGEISFPDLCERVRSLNDTTIKVVTFAEIRDPLRGYDASDTSEFSFSAPAC